MIHLLAEIRKCTYCEEHLALGARPVLVANQKAKIVIIGQAPGTKVHASGIPWNDQSGKRLRQWLGVEDKTFYNEDIFAIVPMGFCYPGKGKSGDLPPRKECAPKWHQKIFEKLPNVELILLIGNYAQKYYLKKKMKKNLTETVLHYSDYLPLYLPLPHPSPRNGIWLKKNNWFERGVLPTLKERVQKIVETY